MKKSKKRTPVLPSEHTPEELQLREYADKINPLAELIKKNQKRKEDKTPYAISAHKKDMLPARQKQYVNRSLMKRF